MQLFVRHDCYNCRSSQLPDLFVEAGDVRSRPTVIVNTRNCCDVMRMNCDINKKLSYCWETVRRESMPRIAEMDVKITT